MNASDWQEIGWCVGVAGTILTGMLAAYALAAIIVGAMI